MEQSRLHAEFKCRCQPEYCDTIATDKPHDPPVIIKQCGCIFQKTHLENILRAQTSTNVVGWFVGKGEITQFCCPNRDSLVGETFRVSDVIVDPSNRYQGVLEASLAQMDCENFGTLTQDERLNTRQFALIPAELGRVLKEIYNEQKEIKWEGMHWSAFKGLLGDLRESYRRGTCQQGDLGRLRQSECLARETLSGWEVQINSALPRRKLAFDQARWSPIKKIIFSARCIYHFAVAILFKVGLEVLRKGNFVTSETRDELIGANVGDRLAILLLERNGIGYNLQETPLSTVEYRLWRHVTTR